MYGSVRAQVFTFPIKQINRLERWATLVLKLKETCEPIEALTTDGVKMVHEGLAEIRKSSSEVAGEAGNARKRATIESKMKEKYEHMQALTDRLEILYKELGEIRKSLSEVAGEVRNAKEEIQD